MPCVRGRMCANGTQRAPPSMRRASTRAFRALETDFNGGQGASAPEVRERARLTASAPPGARRRTSPTPR
eukprot:4249984-Alexandrium_andersonii.AAC.1